MTFKAKRHVHCWQEHRHMIQACSVTLIFNGNLHRTKEDACLAPRISCWRATLQCPLTLSYGAMGLGAGTLCPCPRGMVCMHGEYASQEVQHLEQEVHDSHKGHGEHAWQEVQHLGTGSTWYTQGARWACLPGSTASGNRKYMIPTRGMVSMPGRKYSTWNRKYMIHKRDMVSMHGRKYSNCNRKYNTWSRKYSTWDRKYMIHTKGMTSMRGRKYSTWNRMCRVVTYLHWYGHPHDCWVVVRPQIL